jgi:hypothetical protein
MRITLCGRTDTTTRSRLGGPAPRGRAARTFRRRGALTEEQDAGVRQHSVPWWSHSRFLRGGERLGRPPASSCVGRERGAVFDTPDARFDMAKEASAETQVGLSRFVRRGSQGDARSDARLSSQSGRRQACEKIARSPTNTPSCSSRAVRVTPQTTAARPRGPGLRVTTSVRQPRRCWLVRVLALCCSSGSWCRCLR